MDPRATPIILELDVERGLLSAPPENPLAALRALNSPTLASVVAGLRRAAHDPLVRGLVVHVGTCPLTSAQVDELGAAIAAFGESKPTAAYAASYGELSSGMLAYRLACRAAQVWVQPSGSLVLAGVHAEITLLRGGLDKLGVTPQLSQRHEYKSAAEQVSAHEVSGANREMVQRIVDSLAEDTVALVSERRRLGADAVWEAVNGGPLNAANALERGFVDRVGYRDEVYAAVRSAWSPEGEAQLRFVSRYEHRAARRVLAPLVHRGKPVVAVVTITGGIVTGRGNPGVGPRREAASDVVGDHLRAVGRDESVKAVVLRIDSPGGSYIASDTIRREVVQLRRGGRPVVVSMGDVAASGGYFVSMAADEIVATPSTLTGSIGVYGGKFVTAGLYDKLGLVREGHSAGAVAGMLSSDDPFTEQEWAILNVWLDEVYADFTAKAAADRGIALDVLEPLARGRVWTGSDARQRGLVDHLGGLDLAIDRACDLAGLRREASLVRAMPRVPLLERFKPAESSEATGAATVSVLPTPEGIFQRAVRDLGLAPTGVLQVPWTIRLR